MQASSAGEQSDPLGLALLETPDLRLIYQSPRLDYLTAHAVRTFTASLRWQNERFGWLPAEKTTVMLKDFTDRGAGNATVIPVNRLNLEVSPNSNPLDTNPSIESLASLMNHELVHVATGDVAESRDRFWRRLLGGKVSARADNPETIFYSYLTAPRFNVPRWLLEGSAVFIETWMGGGLGRAQGGYDEMVFRAMVRDGAPFFDPLALQTSGTRSDFQVGANAYLYGTRFMTWLAHAYSADQLIRWLRRDEGSERHYAAAFEQVFGLPLDSAWGRWVAFEKAFQQANLASVRGSATTPLQPLTARALGSSSRLFLDAERQLVYGAFRQTGVVEHIGALDLRDGSVRRLADIQGGALYTVSSLAWDPARRRIFYTARNYNRRDLMVLDVDSGRQTLLIKGGRIGELAFNRADGALIAVRHEGGRATLVRIPAPHDAWEELHTFPYGVVPTDLDVSADGHQMAASVSDDKGEQHLQIWSLPELLQEPGRLVTLARTGFGQAAPEGFVFNADGSALYGSSYYTGISNIYRFEPASGHITPVSNAETGLFQPLPRADGSLIVLAYTGEGLQPALMAPRAVEKLAAIRFLGTELVERQPGLKTWQVAPPSSVDAEALMSRAVIYRPLEHLEMLAAYPVLQAYKDSAGLGLRIDVGDRMGYADGSLVLAATPDRRLPAAERLHAEAKASYLGWRGVVAWNRSDFYDLFGPTKRSRKGWRFALGHDVPLIHETPRRLDLRFDVARYTGIDTLPGAQNEAASFSALSVAEVALKYADMRRSLGAVDDEKGLMAQAQLALHRSGGRIAQQAQAGLDLGWSLPWPHASLWSRTAVGAGRGRADNQLADFYFGGFGNNWVDNGRVQRYRDAGSLPGFGIDEISARSFVRQQAELLLPRLLFDSIGTPDVHLTWLRPQLFAAVLWADPQRPAARRYGSVGGQVDLRLGVLHWYDMTVSAGYAHGFSGGRRAGREWMLSLKVM